MRLIDADAFREFLEEIRQDYREEDTLSSGFAACVIETVQDEYLALAPTVDAVEVVHGRWETANDGTHFCPHCGCDAPYTWDDIDRNFINSVDDVPDRPSNYCPNCGAKMDGDGNV